MRCGGLCVLCGLWRTIIAVPINLAPLVSLQSRCPLPGRGKFSVFPWRAARTDSQLGLD